MPPAAPALSRRTALAALLTTASCATPGQTLPPFSMQNGIGSRATGPQASLYTDLTGSFPRASRANWWQPAYSVDSFSRLDEVFPAAPSAAAGQAAPLRRAPAEPAVQYDGAPALGAGRFNLDGYLDRNPATGLLIAQDGVILAERYQYGRTDRHRLTSFSMAKTIVALLYGIAMEEGHIRSLDDTAAHYAPALQGSEYGATPLRHLLTMSSGMRFREEYDGNDDSSRLSALSFGGQSAGGAAVARAFDWRLVPPGQRWYYASADTFALALALRQAIGQPIARYCSDKIWQPMGAEADASWLTDRSGLEVGYMGFNAVLRDYARLGMLLAAGGQAQGRQVIPRGWLSEMTRAHIGSTQTGRWYGYGYQTWIFPQNDGSFALLGVRGQCIFVDPARRLVMVHTAVRTGARDPGGADATALWSGLKRALPRLA